MSDRDVSFPREPGAVATQDDGSNNPISADPSPALSVRGLSKSFGPTQALAPLDLEILPGEVHALLGENGSGKSTLIKCLSGYHHPDSGEVEIAGQKLTLGSSAASYAMGCRFVHQDLGLIGTETVLDNLCVSSGYKTRFGTIRQAEARRSALADLERVGGQIDPKRVVATLSPAEQTAVAVARALRPDGHTHARLLVLDEPTARLPEREVSQLLDIVRQVASAGVAVIYVSHRIDEVLEVADRTTVLRDGYKVATREVADLDRASLVQLLIGGDIGQEEADPNVAPNDDAPVLFRVTDIASEHLSSVSFEVKRGEVLGIAGITGSGRETILATLFGGLPRYEGSVVLDGKEIRQGRPDLSIAAGVAYLPPDRKTAGALMELTARENFVLADVGRHWRWPRLRLGAEKIETKAWFERLNVRPSNNVDRLMSAFSGGNQQKVLFGKWLRLTPSVLLLDEPTQGVDIATKAELHKEIIHLAGSGSCVVLSSSDTEELVAVCHRILIMRGGRIAETLAGSEITAANLSHASFGTAQAEAV